MEHLGSFWHTDTPAERLALLEDAVEIHTDSQRVPHNLSEIRPDTQQQLELIRLVPAPATMMIDTKVPTRWYPVASVYQTYLDHHRQNDALLMRIYKQTTGLSW